jgi:NAD-dependent SIR2 family protein deacetylase
LKEVLFLGAGASVEAGVPGAFAMTDKILANLRSKARFGKHAHALSFVVGGLLFEAGKKNSNPLQPAVNVEDLFNAVQLLAERSTLEAAPFIGSWHSFLDELDTIYPSQPSGNLQRLIFDAVAKQILSAISQRPPSFASKKIDNSLASTINKTIQAALKNRSISLGSSDSVGNTVERYITELTDKWSSKLKSPSLSGSDKIAEQIKGQIKASHARSGEGRIFSETTELMIAALKDLVWIEDARKTAYLSPILNVLDIQKHLVVATLNYDNSVELLASSQSLSCDTGISNWSTNGRFNLSDPGLHLIKLHGSIDWRRDYEQTAIPQMPTVKIRQLGPEDVKRPELRPAVIFGNRNKLTAEGPFLDLLKAFQDELATAQILTVVGYSFRDSHINVYISQWLNTDANRVLRVVNGPNFNQEMIDASDTPAYVRELLRFAFANPDRVRILAEYAGEGLKKLYGAREFKASEAISHTTQPALERISDDVPIVEQPPFEMEADDMTDAPSESGEDEQNVGPKPPSVRSEL